MFEDKADTWPIKTLWCFMRANGDGNDPSSKPLAEGDWTVHRRVYEGYLRLTDADGDGRSVDEDNDL